MQEYWSGLSFPRTQGLNPSLLHLLHWQVDSLPPVPLGKPNLTDSLNKNILAEMSRIMFDQVPAYHGLAKLTHKINCHGQVFLFDYFL